MVIQHLTFIQLLNRGQAVRLCYDATSHHTQEVGIGDMQMNRPASPLGARPAHSLGPTLRRLRKQNGLSLKALAERAGCSESMLSKIETGHANPSLTTLHRIVAGLGISMAALFEAQASATDIVFKQGTRPMLEIDSRRGKSISLEQLIPNGSEHLLQANIHIVHPSGASEGEISHEGEEAGYVLEGEVELVVNGRSYHLEPGDFFVFPSHLPHGYRNAGTKTARILWVNTPVTF